MNGYSTLPAGVSAALSYPAGPGGGGRIPSLFLAFISTSLLWVALKGQHTDSQFTLPAMICLGCQIGGHQILIPSISIVWATVGLMGCQLQVLPKVPICWQLALGCPCCPWAKDILLNLQRPFFSHPSQYPAT